MYFSWQLRAHSLTGEKSWKTELGAYIQSDTERQRLLHKFFSAFYFMVQDHQKELSTFPPQSTSSKNYPLDGLLLGDSSPARLTILAITELTEGFHRLIISQESPPTPPLLRTVSQASLTLPTTTLALALPTPSIFITSFCLLTYDLDCQGDTLSWCTMVFSIKWLLFKKWLPYWLS